jgi:iron complex outermembrane receptor protein
MFERVRCVSAMAMFCLLVLATPFAQAQALTQFDLPAQPLADSLRAVAKQTNTNVLFERKLVQGLTAPAYKAQATLNDALLRLLSGTGITHRFVNERTVTLSAETQEEGAGLEELRMTVPEVLVVGSKVLNMDVARTRDDAQPYVVFGRENLEQSSAPTLEQFLRDRLSMSANSLQAGQRATFAGVSSTINLRGLGAQQTLILIDGHRMVSGPTLGAPPFQPDINAIPMSAVERVEVLPATASGIYGGGATGGVINIILRHGYEGADVKLTYGNSFDGDARSRRVDLAQGLSFNEGRTNILLAGSFSDQKVPSLADRSELAERYYEIARANDPALLLPPNTPLGTTPNIRSVNGSNLVLDNGTPLGSSFTYVPSGYAGRSSDSGAAFLANAGQYTYGLAGSSQSLTGADLALGQSPTFKSFTTTVRHQFSDRWRAFLNGSISETKSEAPTLISVGVRAPLYTVAANAPNNPFNTDVAVTIPTDSLATTLSSDFDIARIVGGIVVALPADWSAGMDYTWAQSRTRFTGLVGTTGTERALINNGTLDVLRDTNAFPVDLSPYVVRGWGGPQTTTMHDVTMRFAGPVYELPGGPITVASLLEYKDEEVGTASQLQPPTTGIFYPARSQSNSSFYLETKIPIVSARNSFPGVRELEVQLAGRYDRYRTVGTTGFILSTAPGPVVTGINRTQSTNPTFAVRYQPLNDLTLRMSYGTGFVPPGISQLASSLVPVPVSFADARRGGTMTTLPAGSVLQGGNPGLSPEKSRSLSAGIVVTPRFVSGLRLSLDYVRIRKTDNIADYPGGSEAIIIDEALYPERVRRGPNLPGDPAGWAGPITFLDRTLFNIASAEVEAFDLQLDYSWATRLGDFHFSTVATKQTHYKTQSLAGRPELENVGREYLNPTEWNGSADLTWRWRGWSAGWVARYVDSYLTVNPDVPSPITANAIRLQGNNGVVPSQMYHDVFVKYAFGESGAAPVSFLADTQIQLGIRNLFDELPPFDARYYQVLSEYYSPRGEVLGRTFQFTLQKQF